MGDPNQLLSFIFQVLQYGGGVVTGVGVFLMIKGFRERDADAREMGMWTTVAGVAAFLIGGWLSGFSFPTL